MFQHCSIAAFIILFSTSLAMFWKLKQKSVFKVLWLFVCDWAILFGQPVGNVMIVFREKVVLTSFFFLMVSIKSWILFWPVIKGHSCHEAFAHYGAIVHPFTTYCLLNDSLFEFWLLAQQMLSFKNFLNYVLSLVHYDIDIKCQLFLDVKLNLCSLCHILVRTSC